LKGGKEGEEEEEDESSAVKVESEKIL